MKSSMKMAVFSAALGGLLMVLAAAPPARAAVPELINFQGKLTGADGKAVSRLVPIVFKFYTAAAGGSPVWTETRDITPDNYGIYSVMLGEIVPFNLNFSVPYWLGVSVGSDTEMTPRYRIVPSAYSLYALNSATAAWAEGADWASLTNKPAVTAQGNVFNGASQLVQLGADGKLPAVDGSNLTGLPAAVLADGSVTRAKMADLAAYSLIGNNTGLAAAPLALNAGSVKTLLGLDAATAQGNVFNGASQLVQLGADGKLPAVDGSNLTGMVTAAGAGGPVTSARTAEYALNSATAAWAEGADWASLTNKPAVTAQGNVFNGASQLVQLGADGKLPAVDGSNLTGLPAAVVADGSVTLAKMADLAAYSLIGNNTGLAGAPSALNAGSVKTLLGLENVDNVSINSWAGSGNITTVGTIGAGVWNGAAVGDGYIASALTGKTYNGLTVTPLGTGFSLAGGAASRTLTVNGDAAVSGVNTGDQISVTGNAGTVTNGVYTAGDQTVGGVKTFTSTVLAKGFANASQSVVLTNQTSFAADGSGMVLLTFGGTVGVTTITGCSSGAVGQGQIVTFVVAAWSVGGVSFVDTIPAAAADDTMLLNGAAGTWTPPASAASLGAAITLLCTTINTAAPPSVAPVKLWVEVGRSLSGV